jgi:hypothetical protein
MTLPLMDENIEIVTRPPFQLRSLPVKYRWEANRRHPYYQLFWQFARALHEKKRASHPGEAELQSLAIHTLYAIGVSGMPPDPSLEFDELVDEQMNPAWLGGAVHPVSFRGLANMLIAFLEPEAIRSLGELFGTIQVDDPASKFQAVEKLVRLEHPSLDLGPPEPYVSVNPAASSREIGKAIDKLLAQWKQRHGLNEQRVRSDKFDDYLIVWDLREGWAEGHYDRSKERSFVEIAKELKRSRSTIENRYRQAFELVIGYPYRPELWHYLFDLLKFSEFVDASDRSPPDIRRQRSEGRKPLPETSLGDFEPGYGPVTGSSTSGDHTVDDFWIDINDLIQKGRSDVEIATELELPPEAIAAARRRIEDGLDDPGK